MYLKKTVIVDNILSKEIITKELLNQNSLSEIVELAKLDRIYNISTNTGDVSYNQNVEEIVINIANADAEEQVLNPTKYSKIVNSSERNNLNSFDDKIDYGDEEGYSGILNKDGDVQVISGTYIPEVLKVAIRHQIV